MFRIRAEQIETMRVAREQELIGEVAGFLRTRFPSIRESDQVLRERLRELLDRMQRCGITAEQDFARVANVAAALEWKFDAHPWLAQYLADRSVADPGERVRRVVSRGIREKEREETSWRARQTFKGGTRG